MQLLPLLRASVVEAGRGGDGGVHRDGEGSTGEQHGAGCHGSFTFADETLTEVVVALIGIRAQRIVAAVVPVAHLCEVDAPPRVGPPAATVGNPCIGRAARRSLPAVALVHILVQAPDASAIPAGSHRQADHQEDDDDVAAPRHSRVLHAKFVR